MKIINSVALFLSLFCLGLTFEMMGIFILKNSFWYMIISLIGAFISLGFYDYFLIKVYEEKNVIKYPR
jgi:hypothetical protein